MRLEPNSIPAAPGTFQSTHPRGVRHADGSHDAQAEAVSIHAPAWGATQQILVPLPLAGKFQSTHPRGVRRSDTGRPCVWRQSFNPRTRVGCDPPAHPTWCKQTLFQSTHPRGVRLAATRAGQLVMVVSIHAPAWGATFRTPRPCATWARIIPRTREACDTAASQQNQSVIQFQSTHPRGVRLSACGTDLDIKPRFQSTHPRGVRQMLIDAVLGVVLVSIHAPAWGATDLLLSWECGETSFNPRTRVGCDVQFR